MRRYLFLSLICFYCVCGLGQKIIINGQKCNRNLEWADFTGKPDINSTYYANTWYSVKYSYNVTTTGDAATLSSFEVTLELDPSKSWAKSDKVSDELLAHEQGHFNIGILCMREVLSVVNKMTLTKTDYADAIRNVYGEIMRKYNEMNVQYDSETDHFKNKEQQQKWNALLAEKLAPERK
jgi:hypothetical protein